MITTKSKSVKKDSIFIITMALTIASLGYNLMTTLGDLTFDMTRYSLWLLVLVDMIAISGCLWLVRSHRISIRLAKENISGQEKQTEEKEVK